MADTDVPCALGQYDLHCHTLDELVVKDVINESNFELVMTSRVVEVLVGGDVIADVMTGLPTTEQGEPTERERRGGG